VVRQEPQDSDWKTNLDLGKILMGLQNSITELKEQQTYNKRKNRRTVRWNVPENTNWFINDKSVCNCAKLGHYARNYFKNLSSPFLKVYN